MSLSGHLLMPKGIDPPCFSFIRFIMMIHCLSIEKGKYLTPAHSLKTTRSSHSAKYCRYQTYCDALKNSFFPWTIPQWNSLSPSVVNSQTIEEFRAFGLPGVMIVFGRASKGRKKSEPELYVFYGNLNYKLKRIMGKSPFSGSIQNDNLRAFACSDKQIRIILHQTSSSPCLLLPRRFIHGRFHNNYCPSRF